MKSNLIKVIAVILVILTVVFVPSIAFEKQLAEITTTFFAAEIWKCVSKKRVIPLMFPPLAKIQILILGGKRTAE